MSSITSYATIPTPSEDFLNSVTIVFLSHTFRITAAAGTILARYALHGATCDGLHQDSLSSPIFLTMSRDKAFM